MPRAATEPARSSEPSAPDHAAGLDPGLPRLELRLDQDHQLARRAQEVAEGGDDLGDGDERQVQRAYVQILPDVLPRQEPAGRSTGRCPLRGVACLQDAAV